MFYPQSHHHPHVHTEPVPVALWYHLTWVYYCNPEEQEVYTCPTPPLKLPTPETAHPYKIRFPIADSVNANAKSAVASAPAPFDNIGFTSTMSILANLPDSLTASQT